MPEAMPMAPLSEVANITMGQSPDSAYVNGNERGLPFLQGCADFGIRFPEPRVHCFPPFRVGRANSTLISVRAPVGTTNQADRDYCIGRGLAAVLAKPGSANNIFLLHAIKENLSYLYRRSQGSTFLAIGSTDLSMMPVAAPTLPQQQCIADIISTVDEAIEQTEALVAKYQKIKDGLMNDLFTRGVTPDGRLRPTRDQAPHLYKDSTLGWIPKEWEAQPLGGVADLDVGFAFKSEWFGSEGVNLLRGENVGYGTADWLDRQCLPLSRMAEFSSYALQAGDIVIGMDRTFTKNGVKITVLTPDDCPALLVQRVGRFRALKCHKAYLQWLVKSPVYLRALFIQQKGMDIPHLSKAEILTPQVPIGPNAEQEKIADSLQRIEIANRCEEKWAGKLRTLKRGIMHDLLTGRVRVKEAAQNE